MQLVHFVGWLIQLIYYVGVFLWVPYPYSPVVTVIYALFLIGYIVLIVLYGTGDFSRLEIKGPYKVGTRKFRTLKLNPHPKGPNPKISK